MAEGAGTPRPGRRSRPFGPVGFVSRVQDALSFAFGTYRDGSVRRSERTALAYDRTLIQIRERSFLDLLDLAVVVLRKKARPVGLAALAGILPCALLNAWLTSDPEFPPVLYFALLLLEAPWATAPVTVVLGGLMFGERPTTRQAVRTLLRGLPALLLYQALVRTLLMVSVVFYPIVPTRLAFVDEVILLERGKARTVVKRSSTLCGDRGADYFGHWLAQLVFGALFVLCFWRGVGVLVNALFDTDLKVSLFETEVSDVYGVRVQVAVWVAVTFFGVARFLTYIDQRIRLEGWEIKLRLHAVGRSLEEASRW